jgi:hypothetical protein
LKFGFAAVLLFVSAAQAAEVSGLPRIVDGDTVRIGSTYSGKPQVRS